MGGGGSEDKDVYPKEETKQLTRDLRKMGCRMVKHALTTGPLVLQIPVPPSR
jgi:hypothetical protein